MITADWIAIVIVVLACLLGLWLGFGKGLKFFTKGIFGIIIAVFACYCLGGFILNIGVVNELVTNLHTTMSEGNVFLQFLATIHIEIVVYYIALFIVCLIVRLIIVKIIVSVAEANNGFIKFLNKTFGMVFFVAVFALLALIVFQIIYAINGTTPETIASDSFYMSLNGSFFKLDAVYENNPFLMIIKIITIKKEILVPVV